MILYLKKEEMKTLKMALQSQKERYITFRWRILGEMMDISLDRRGEFY